jgi:dihydropteroate synthase
MAVAESTMNMGPRPHVALWRTTRFELDVTHPLVMGIVNVTPDSFSDGGHYANSVAAISHAEKLVQEGAHIVDIGGESTRPGAKALNAEEEWQRLAPVFATSHPMEYSCICRYLPSSNNGKGFGCGG